VIGSALLCKVGLRVMMKEVLGFSVLGYNRLLGGKIWPCNVRYRKGSFWSSPFFDFIILQKKLR
jgi:hypothetical protein